MTIWIIMWSHYDNSGFGVLNRAFTDEAEAQWQAKLLDDMSDRTIAVLPVELKQ